MVKQIFRLIIALITGLAGFSLAYYLFLKTQALITLPGNAVRLGLTVLLTLFTVLIGYAVGPWLISLITQIVDWVESRLQKIPAQELIGGALGLITGLLIADLLGSSFSQLKFIGPYISIILSLFFGYIGLKVGAKKRDEIFSMLNILPRFSGKEKGLRTDLKHRYKILDTSVIIDGRIADICKSGFIEGTLLIPNFVLEELRHIADSSDLLKRNRGRRGLDILNKIRKELDVMVKIDDRDFDDLNEVDSKLIRLGQVLGAPVITNDYNLNKVAELQEVKVLNINELANAVKPVVLPGEEMTVQVIKDGKELGQGVAYLDDGTMIVIDGGRKFMGQTISVLVTSVLQTAAGRMIFAKLKAPEKKVVSSQPGQVSEVNVIG